MRGRVDRQSLAVRRNLSLTRELGVVEVSSEVLTAIGREDDRGAFHLIIPRSVDVLLREPYRYALFQKSRIVVIFEIASRPGIETKLHYCGNCLGEVREDLSFPLVIELLPSFGVDDVESDFTRLAEISSWGAGSVNESNPVTPPTVTRGWPEHACASDANALAKS
jgi:hypothetical protein